MSDDKELDALVAKVAAVHELDDCNSDTYMLLLHLSDAITALRLSLSKMTEARDFVVGLHSQACREACALRAALEECGFTGSLPEGEYDRLVRELVEHRAHHGEPAVAGVEDPDG